MPTTILSGRQSTTLPPSARLVLDVEPAIQYLEADRLQFSTMLMDSRVSSDKAESYKVEWQEDRLIPRVLSLGASATSSATTLTTGTGEAAYAKTGDLIRVPSTGEAVRVTASDGAQALTVIRAIGAVGAASANSGGNGTLIIVGGSNDQGAGLPTRLITQNTFNYNYTQIVRNAYGFTRTARQSHWYGGDMLEIEREKKAVEHKADIENMLFFGARSYTASGPRHTAGGLIEYVSTNVTNANGTFSKASLQSWLTTSLQFARKPVIFAAPKVGEVFSNYLADNWVRTDPGVRYYGAKVNAVLSGAFGEEVPVVIKRQWGEYGTGTAGQYGSIAFVVDMAHVKLAKMQSSVNLRDRQAPDIDAIDEEYLAELSLKVMVEQSHSLLKNVTG